MDPGNPAINETGTVNVTGVNADGTRSTWTVNSLLENDEVAGPTRDKGAYVNILDGGKISAGTIQLGESTTAPTFGYMTVNGVDTASGLASTLDVTGTLNSFMGKTIVEDGGYASVGDTYLDAESQLTVEGVNTTGTVSTFAVNGQFLVDSRTTTSGTVTTAGFVLVQDGGLLNTDSAIIGTTSSSRDLITITGTGSQWENTGSMTVGESGTTTLNVSDGGDVTTGGGDGTIDVAENSGSTATINIGAAAGSAATDPGTIHAALIQGGSGTGVINFNHTSSNYHFAPDIAGNITVEQNAGTTILEGANSYLGPTIIHGGVLELGGADAASIASQIELTGGTFDLSGFSPSPFGSALIVAGAGSTLDFGFGHSGGVTLEFADSSLISWTSDLDLTDFTVGTDELGFGDSTGLTGAQLADIDLAGYDAVGLDSSGFVEFEAEVPEPTASSLLPIVFALIGLGLWNRWQRTR